ncbi:MAG TPA: peptidoglycan DD-metalloendopeptidase family protein, partial [Cyclobacteriaceae bacterium]|nr:peptidoglycan DD-metalloendopeptidase family protein [Cyclobacteriaceae bacterium]
MRSCWNLKLSEWVALFATGFLVVVFSVPSSAQMSEKDTPILSAPEEQYLFPVHPGQSNQLAGTMGELRSTHFHGGIDIRTNNQTGIPIFAAQKGYISRVSCSTTGYGNAIYITHPDGNTTVYGHLDKFNGPLNQYVRGEKYKGKVSEINLTFTE